MIIDPKTGTPATEVVPEPVESMSAWQKDMIRGTKVNVCGHWFRVDHCNADYPKHLAILHLEPSGKTKKRKARICLNK